MKIPDISVIEKKENPLFKRKEIKFTVGVKIAPNYAEAREMVSKKFSIPEENIRIKKIFGKFGTNIFTISANVYESEQDKLNAEGQSKKDIVKEEKTPEQIQQDAVAQSSPVADSTGVDFKVPNIDTPFQTETPVKESKEEKTE